MDRQSKPVITKKQNYGLIARTWKQPGQKGSYYIYRIGGSLFESYVKEYAGVDPDTGKALYYVDPDNGDYTTSDYSAAKQADQVICFPKYMVDLEHH